MTRRHPRPHSDELEGTPVADLVAEVRYLRGLIRAAADQVPPLRPQTLEVAWTAEVMAGRDEDA